MSLSRVLRTQAVTLAHVFYVGEVPTDPTGTVTCTVKRLDDTSVASGNAQTIGAGTGRMEFALTGQAELDTLTVDWQGSVAESTRTERDYLEVAGGFIFELAEARSLPPALDATKYPASLLETLRVEVEQECERISHMTFVPRFKRVALPGTGHSQLLAPHTDLRRVRAVSVDGVAWTAEQVAAVDPSDSGVLTLPSGSWPAPWASGRRNIIVEYEHGLDQPSYDIRKAAMVRLRSRAGMTDTTVPYRAISFTPGDGGTYRLSTPSRERTGIPDVDAAYEGARQDVGGFA